MNFFNYFKFILCFVVLGSGCAAVDLTQDNPNATQMCEVHNEIMHTEEISVFGEMVYVQEYVIYAKKNFPNHGGHLLNYEKVDTPRECNVIDYVCPKCNAAYEAYWTIKGKL